MILHLFKLVWNRRRTNLLIVAEILGSFLVVFALGAAAVLLWQRQREPLGFNYTDVWQIDVSRNALDEWGSWEPNGAASTYRGLLRSLEAMEGVVAVAAASTAPYKGSVFIQNWDHEQRSHEVEVAIATPELREVLGLELVSGRWVGPEDSALDWRAVVVDEDLARALFGDEDPVGMRVSGESEPELRVVGVVRDFRRGGELDANGSYAFYSAQLEKDDGYPLSVILVRLAPDTPADFEEPLTKTLEAVAPGWSFDVTHLEEARSRNLRETLVPLAAIGLVACFLLLMVVLGLTGVMWQNVTRRTREIGLRRATGADRGRIQRQIVGEAMITAALGLGVGSLIAIQVPLIGPLTFIPYSVVLPALAASSVLILILVGLCGFYPAWSATRIRPAEALHYE